MISDHPTAGPAFSSSRRPTIEPQAAASRIERLCTQQDNSNVLNILPVTTLRTIDLEGKKNSGRERAIFLRETLHQNMCSELWGPGAMTGSHICLQFQFALSFAGFGSSRGALRCGLSCCYYLLCAPARNPQSDQGFSSGRIHIWWWPWRRNPCCR